jgi:hypothetical protein
MPEPATSIESVFSAIARAGLVARGAFHLTEPERTGALARARTIALIGVVGSRGWDPFAASPEALDGRDHPLDRYSRRVVGGLADELRAVALYPFGGPPYWPFQQWARRAEPVHPSPLGLLVHPTYGLWHSYRGALGFQEALALTQFDAQPSPCESCRGRPCLGACPVGAFVVGGYDVPACVAHLRNAAGADCMGRGCLARRVCPVGAAHAQGAAQASFTMRAFRQARLSTAGAE